MNNSTLTKIVNYLIEGLIMFFFIVVFLFIMGDKGSSSIHYDEVLFEDMLLFVPMGLFVVTWLLLKIRIVGIQTKYCVVISLLYAFIGGFMLYTMGNESYFPSEYYVKFSTFPLLWLIMEITWLVIRYILNSILHKNEKYKIRTNSTHIKMKKIKRFLSIFL